MQRQRLVWLSAAAWQRVLAADAAGRDGSTLDCLRHWAAHGLPLVVTGQPPRAAAGSLALGLAAPLRWGSRRIVVDAQLADIQHTAEFPELIAITELLREDLRPAWRDLCAALAAQGLAVHVHGSHGWQALSGLDCIHAASDIDLLVTCPDLAQADAAVAVLQAAPAGLPRLDGELLFADGSAVAWREWAMWRAGAVRHVLVKRLRGAVLEGTATQPLARAAVAALHDELALAPKPGLVSFIDSGSHVDMDAALLLRSLFTLRHYFVQVAALGAGGADFAALEAAGIAAEARMLRATRGVNTHRGAIFTLGLLCAAAGAVRAQRQPVQPAAIRAALRAHWGAALHARASPARGAGAEAAAGFPTLFEVTLPALLQPGLSPRQARVRALLQTIAELDDTNLVRRGGEAGARWARQAARDWLAAGDANPADGLQRAQALHREFVVRRLSPGGAADLLAAACWLQRVTDAPA